MADVTPDVNTDETDSPLLDEGFATGTEGEGYQDAQGGTD